MKTKLLITTVIAYIIVVVYLFCYLSFWMAAGMALLVFTAFAIIYNLFSNMIDEAERKKYKSFKDEVENIAKLSK